MSTTEAPSAPEQRLPDSSGSAHLPGQPEPLSEDEVFHLLQCRRRRDALRYLHEHDGGPVRMRDLAEQVAAWEHETTVAALSSKERQRVYIPLYQTHLSKLDEAGVIEYDRHRGRVAVGPLADQLVPYLRVDDEEDQDAEAEPATGTPWGRYFAGASLLALVALGGVAVVGQGVSSTAGLVSAVAVFATFGLLTLARLFDRSETGDLLPPDGGRAGRVRGER